MGILEELNAMFQNVGRGPSGSGRPDLQVQTLNSAPAGHSPPQTYEAYYGKDAGKPAPVR